ncbi:fibronectin type III domain-containing protein [Flavobacterium sangjuense]|uniref:Fibronectin type-III domain-containing protein n=1 Tax=Flavobacterium sangjuense TaxID=2518177 RepID=A0A4P7PUR3_9FLAO|nr:fibronectin type III domain-containing protein [Flavobacterium sangjuense]QBZ98721.1 hypothetical protein GS03_02231 [Flavobacterium sangjuense]
MKKCYSLVTILFFALQLLVPTQLEAQCNAPVELSAANVSQTTAYLHLNTTTANSLLYNIRYHISGTATWTVLEHVGLPYQLGNLVCGSTYEWQAQLICTNSAGTTLSDWSSSSTFATLACTTTPCNAPTGLSATNITQTGASLYLSPTSGNTGTFHIRYHVANTTTWTVLENVTLPYQLGNLTCGTTYEWQVRLVCPTGSGTTTVSPISAAGTFTTLACNPEPCNTPTGLTAGSVSQTGANLYLTPTSTNTGTFNIRYHAGTSTTWTVIERVTLPYQLGNLTCGTTYEWQVQRICTSSSASATTTTLSDWSTGGAFTTLACTTAPCNAPIGLSVTNVSQTGAYLYLSPTSGNAGFFNIRYHAANVATWTAVEHVTLPYQLGNLTCGTTYEWQAQLICTNSATGATTVSPWSTAGTFTTLACTTEPCNAPTGLTAGSVSQTGANLYLTPTSTNTGTFNIRYHAGTSTTWTVIERVTLPYQLGNLTCGTTYEWQVRRICASPAGSTTITLSDWSTSGTFTTLACTPEPCNTPTGLTATNVSQTGANLYLTPTSSNTGTFNIRYHVGTSTTWTVLEHVTLPYQLGNLTCGTNYEWQVRRICTSPAGTITLSDWSTAGTFTTLACTPEPCNTPTGLTVGSVSQTGANLYLTPTSSNTGTFNIRYHAGTTATWTVLEHVTLPYQLGNLTCGTTYEWQIRRVCTSSSAGTTTLSDWSTAGTFTTLACTTAPCNAPTGLTATNVSQTGAYLYLSPTSGNAGVFNIRYHAANATTWTAIEHVTLPYQLGNLTCGTTYEWQVQLICPNATGATTTTVSPWSTGGTFTTLACTTEPCNTPTGLTAISVSQTGANLYLTPTSSNTGTFNIRYHAGASTTWTVVERVTLPYQLGNLNCGTTYEWQVRRVCTSSSAGTTTTTLSDWSTAGTFTTLACTTAPCNAPIGLSATNVSQTGAYLYLSPTSGNAGVFNIRYHAANATTWTAVEHVTLPYQLGNLTCGTTYEWQAQLICMDPLTGAPISTVSPWSVGGTFTTLPCTATGCGVPTELRATNINQTSAVLHWNPVPGAVAYIVRYKRANNTALDFISVTSTTNSITLNNLTAGSNYIWQVQAVCSTTVAGLSAFSAMATFVTPSVTVFPNPANRYVNVSLWLPSPTKVYIVLRDSYGQAVYSFASLMSDGNNIIEIDTSSLSTGLYILTVQTEFYTTTKKVVVGR